MMENKHWLIIVTEPKGTECFKRVEVKKCQVSPERQLTGKCFWLQTQVSWKLGTKVKTFPQVSRVPHPCCPASRVSVGLEVHTSQLWYHQCFHS